MYIFFNSVRCEKYKWPPLTYISDSNFFFQKHGYLKRLRNTRKHTENTRNREMKKQRDVAFSETMM